MALQKKRKNKNRNTPGRKSPRIAEIVRHVTRDCTASPEELTDKKADEVELDSAHRIVIAGNELPDGITVVETLNGHWAFKDSRMMNYIETIQKIACEFPEEFWTEDGLSIMELRRDRKNRTWADDQTILQFCYLMIAMNLARWSYTRDKWSTLKSGMPFLKFTCKKRGEKLEENETINEGESNDTNGI